MSDENNSGTSCLQGRYSSCHEQNVSISTASSTAEVSSAVMTTSNGGPPLSRMPHCWTRRPRLMRPDNRRIHIPTQRPVQSPFKIYLGRSSSFSNSRTTNVLILSSLQPKSQYPHVYTTERRLYTTIFGHAALETWPATPQPKPSVDPVHISPPLDSRGRHCHRVPGIYQGRLPRLRTATLGRHVVSAHLCR